MEVLRASSWSGNRGEFLMPRASGGGGEGTAEDRIFWLNLESEISAKSYLNKKKTQQNAPLFLSLPGSWGCF